MMMRPDRRPVPLAEIPASLRDLTPEQLFDLSTLIRWGGYTREQAEEIVRRPKVRIKGRPKA